MDPKLIEMGLLPLLLITVLSSACKHEAASSTIHSSSDKQTPAIELRENPGETPSDSVSLAYLTGRFSPELDDRFIELMPPYSESGGMYLRKEAFNAFITMFEAAEKDGVKLTIISATRPFDRQKQIWEAKWTGKRKVEGSDLSRSTPNPVQRAYKILQYSSMPGTSRHHWGTDIDLNSLDPDYFADGQGAKTYLWLKENALSFGFCQVYSPKGPNRPHGYQEEAWHWSYLPLAKELTRQAKETLTNQDISGFMGAEVADSIDVVNKYILGINPDCMPL